MFVNSPTYKLDKAGRSDDELYAYLRHRVDTLMLNVNHSTSYYDTRLERNSICRRLWNGELDSRTYNYLNNTYETLDEMKRVILNTVPAKLRHYPVVKPNLEHIIQTARGRKLIPRVYAVDEYSADRQTEALLTTVNEYLYNQLQQHNKSWQTKQQAIALKKQMLETMAKEQDPSQTPLVQQLQEEINELNKLVTSTGSVDSENLKKLHRYFQYSYKDEKASLAFSALQEYIERHNLKNLFDEVGLSEQLITGEETYYVGLEANMNEPQLRLVRPENLWYQHSDDNRYICDSGWSVEFMPMNYQEAMSIFTEIPEEEWDRIYASSGMVYGQNHAKSPVDITPDGQMLYNNNFYSRARGYGSQLIYVYLLHWKESVPINVLMKRSEEKDTKGTYHIKEDEIEDILTDEEAEEWRKKATKDEKKQYYIEKRYRNDLYQAYKIGNEIYRYGRCAVQQRREHDLMDVELPYMGYAINNFVYPDSLVWATRELQELYNIVAFKKELAITLSGVKGVVMDLARIPKNMSPEEWVAHRKMGSLYITKTDAEGAYVQGATDNQLTIYDDTLSNSVSNYDVALQSIKNMIATVTGVNEAIQGEIKQNALVGTVEMQQERGNAIMEYHIQRHEHIIEKVLEKLTNLFRFSYKKGRKGFSLYGERQQLLQIEPEDLQESFFRVRIKNSEKELDVLNVAKELAKQQVANNVMPMHTFIEIMDMNNVDDIKHVLKQAQEYITLQQQQEQQQQRDYEERLQQKNLEAQQAIIKMQTDSMKEIEKLKSESNLQLQKLKGEQQERIEQIKANTTVSNANQHLQGIKYKADTDRAVEEQYMAIETAKLAIEKQLQEKAAKISNIKDTFDSNMQLKGISNPGRNRIKD